MNEQQILQTDYLFHKSIFGRPYEIPIIRDRLTRRLASVFPDMMDEMRCALDNEISSSSSDEWTPVTVHPTFMRIICRTTNRTLVGKPLCRNPDWMDINIKYTVDIGIGGMLLQFFPTFLRG